MKIKLSFIVIGMFLCLNISFAQLKNDNSKLSIKPYVGLSSPQGDFKNVSENGSVLGFSLDKYLNSKFALGLDINHQLNAFKNELDYSIISSPSFVNTVNKGSWSNTTITFGPTYSFGNQKFSTEIYTKAGVSFVKSPSSTSTLSHPAFADFEIFDLREQQVTSFGITSGIRFNYSINEKLALFINPQYVISGAEINYYYKDPAIAYFPGTDGTESFYEPGLLAQDPGIEALVKPSYFNLNAGLKISLGKSKETTTQNVNRNLPICDISLVELECDSLGSTLKLMQFWNNFDPTFKRTVEVFNGTTLINPTTSSPQFLSQNYGNIPFYTGINSNLIGASFSAIMKIFDTNGNMVCSKNISFTVPQCSPQPLSCDFAIDLENAICDGTTITYNAIGSWANLNPGSIIDLEAKDQSGSPITITVVPAFPITITAANSTGNTSNTISIPASYNGSQISITMKITEPTTGFVKTCGFLDVFTPVCEPQTSDCNWEYTVSCDPKNNGIKINVTSIWNNMPVGSNLNYSLISQNGGSPIPFTFLPNNLPQTIGGNGTSSHTLFINSSYSNTPVVFKMEIDDGNGALICNKGKDFILPSCIFKICELIENNSYCQDGTNIINFTFNWANYSNFSNYSIYAEITDTSNNNIVTYPLIPLGSASGSIAKSQIIPSQYAGSTIYVKIKICETANGGNKNCCLSFIKIDIPKCCINCFDIDLESADINPNIVANDFPVNGWFNSKPVKKLIFQLEYFNCNDLNGAPIIIPDNFEFSKNSVINGSAVNLIGSLTGDRSNMIVKSFPPSTTGVNFNLLIDNYTNKRVVNFRIKLTTFFMDGTYCESYLSK